MWYNKQTAKERMITLRIGYARVSSEQQNLDRQIDALNEFGIDQLFSEKITGTIADRKELDKIKLIARAGDSVIVESLSRLGRSTKDLLNLLDYFESKNIQLISLKESIDTKSPTGKLLVVVLMAISQFERDLLVQRTAEGLQAARARGRVGGRPKVNSKELEKAIKLYDSQTHSLKEIVEITGISTPTLYRELHRRKQTNEMAT